MDINSLLSPQDSPQSGSTTPAQSPRKTTRRRRSTSLKQGITSSPLSQATLPPSNLPHHVLTPTTKSMASPPAMSPTAGAMGGASTPPPSEVQHTRQPSTPGMDTLADLASMQHHQPARTSAPLLRSAESYESQLSPSTIHPNVQSVSHMSTTPRPSFDLPTTDAPKEFPRTDYFGTSLSETDQQTAGELSVHLQESPQDYASHIKFINLLHQGFVAHVYPPESPDSHGDPHSFDLLDDLRAARQGMDKMFAIGHDLWAEWIQDESMLARTVEERIEVIAMCQKAVEEEYGCTTLWVTYGDWMLYLYNSVQETDQETGQSQWSEEDKLVGKEVFSWQSVLDVWKRGSEETMWRMGDSHLIWDRYMQLLLQQLARNPTEDNIAQVKALFENRLQIPHAAWDQTFETFSTFISTYYNTDYEEIMATTNQKAADAKAIYNAREVLEVKIKRAMETGDNETEWSLFCEYIDSELNPGRRKRVNFTLMNALYQRAVLRFPSDAKLWEDYVMYVVGESCHERSTISALLPLDRATRHCPWSGTLWSQYLLSSEREGQSYIQTEKVKHKATSTGLLEVGGMEEVLKVNTAWCSYLRRRAFQPDSTDEDLDVAEVGIRSAIESLQELGEKKYGPEFKGDPYFRLERIYIKYFTESGSWDSARETYRGLVGRRGDSHDFWLRYYVWEMVAWNKFMDGEKTVEAGRKMPTPSYATAVLRQALKRPNLDWPEKIMEAYISHCEDHEDVEELQLAVAEVRKRMKEVTKKREKEALEAAAKPPSAIQTEMAENGTHIGKRKRSEEAEADESISKKSKPEEETVTAERRASEPSVVKRDRENATVHVKNLPIGISETRIRQYFRDCGTINSIRIWTVDQDSMTVVIEFDSKEDALTAQTRDMKEFDGNTIKVEVGSGSTLYVTNYPPSADETYIRGLFDSYGEVMDVRFPSLQYNTHRRFCYVQFESSSQAQAATALDGKGVDDGLKLVARISNPSAKKGREGADLEGREIYVSNFHWSANESDLKELFSKYGRVKRVRLPRKVDGKHQGFGFVVFSSKDEANAALEMNQQDFRSRPLRVDISSNDKAKRKATTIVSRPGPGHSKSPSLEPNGTAGSPSAVSTSSADRTVSDFKARSLGLMNVPDTVNDSRIRAIAETYGPLVKVVLRPDHQGAIVEFQNVNDVGKASLGLEGHEITPGRKLRVGTVLEMLKQTAEKKADRNQPAPSKKEGDKSLTLQSSGPIKRPNQPGTRGGRRGGLGMKRGLGFGSSKPPDNVKPDEGSHQEQAKAKSNDDFRAMLSNK